MRIVETLEQLSDCIEFSYTLVRDEFNGREGPTVWSCTIVCDGNSYSTEYTKGCGHRVYSKGSPSGMLKRKATNKRITLPFGRMTIHEAEEIKASMPIEPDLTEFMYALVTDAGCVSGADFEDFCSELGYSDDSISAKKTYGACCATYMALVRLGFDLDQLSELFQDY